MVNNTDISAAQMPTWGESAKVKVLQVSTLCFAAYLYFIIDYFLRFSARVPAYGALRPTVLMVLIISFLLMFQMDKLKGKADDPIFKVFIALVIYLFVSLPFVEWPGSVIRANVNNFVKVAVFFGFYRIHNRQ